MVEKKQGVTALEKLFKKYNFDIVPKIMGTRPGWNPLVGLTVRGTTYVYLVYNPGDSEHYWERLAYRGLAEQIVKEFEKQKVTIHA